MIYYIIVLILMYIITRDVAFCESLTFDQKNNLILQQAAALQLNEDFYCFLNSKIFDVFFEIEFLQTSQDVKGYFNTLLNEYQSNVNQFCGNGVSCREKYYDRIRMLKRLFHNENYSFLIHCKSRVTSRIINNSFDQGGILELYYRLSQEFEF